MKKCILSLIVIITLNNAFSQVQPLKSFPLSSVRIAEGPFYQAQQADMRYMLELDPDRLLAPFLIDAGFEPKAERYGNWENTGLDGHIGGHYLSALSFMYASTGNDKLLQRLNYMIDWLAKCQEKNGNGYVGGIPDGKTMWKEIAVGKIEAGSFSLNNRWVPLYNIHKLFAGLRDAYIVAGNKKALDILIKLTDWFLDLTKNLSDDQIQKMLLSEHGGLNEVFADVSELTGNKKYLDLAQKFSHKLILQPLIERQNKLAGLHANTQIPKVIGFERISELTGNKDWAKAAEFFWETVTEKWTVSIGGNSVREHFNPVNDFSSMVESNQGPETCNTYNMLRLTKLLFLSSPDCTYMDYYERALYNHILSSEDPVKGGFVYFTPMRPRHYRVYSQPQESFWCCVGSGLENHGKYGELIYAHNDKDIFVNLFIPSSLVWKEKGISLVQQTKFPYEESTDIKLKLEKSQKFSIKIRYPSWVGKGELKIMVNGKEIPQANIPSSYVSIDRNWKSGDNITIRLPMQTKVEYLPDGSSWASVVHGPIVLAAVTDTTDLVGLWADGSRMGHVANGPLYPVEQAPMIVTNVKDFSSAVKEVSGKPLTFTMRDDIYPDKYKNLELVPFFSIQRARYELYWPVTTSDELEKKKLALHEHEEKILALEKQTIDQVAPGEQQPESDHNFKGEKTESGINADKHWRDAKGWFSYDLKDKNKEAKKLSVTYFGLDKGRIFDIIVNGTLLATVNLDGTSGNKFFDVNYDIPDIMIDQSKNGEINVKFIAHENSIAGGVYYIRLLR